MCSEIESLRFLRGKNVNREQQLPFDVVASDPFYAESNVQHLQHSIQQLYDGKVVTKTLEELQELARS